MTKTTVYYSHSPSDFDTDAEKANVGFLGKVFDEVVNPNTPENQKAYEERGFAAIEDLIAGCNVCAFTRFPDGTLGCGVAKNIEAFLESGEPVFEIIDHERLNRIFAVPLPVLSREETREAIKRFMPVKADEKADEEAPTTAPETAPASLEPAVAEDDGGDDHEEMEVETTSSRPQSGRLVSRS